MTPAPEQQSGFLARLADMAELGRFTKWVLLSSLIGVFGGLAAAGFKWLIEVVVDNVFRRPTGVAGEGAGGLDGTFWLILLVPTLGGLATGWLIQTFAPEAEGHGTDSVIRAFHRLKGVIRSRVIFLKALASAITIGTGGSAGQEGPVAQVGAGVGSSLAGALKLTDRDRRIFLLAGGSAGIGAMFCSPLGGALFMPEVLYRKPDFEGESIIPCIISSIMAYATMTAISGQHRAVEIAPEILEKLRFDDPRELGVYLILGILCALVGFIYTKVFYGTHNIFGSMKAVPKMVRPALGGLLVGVTALAIAGFTGEHGIFFGGYGLMRSSIAGELAIPVLLALLVAKILATSFTISSGGSGGVFAPALAIGALLGAIVGHGAEAILPFDINPACYAVVGMGGFFAGVAKVPIASVIMVSEMTGSYALLAPLMLVAVVHMLLSTRWTMYEAQVDSHVDSPAHAGDFVVDVLQSMRVEDVLHGARRPRMVHEDVTLRGAMKIVAVSHETHFPVVDDDEHLVGVFSLTDLRRIFLENVVEDVIIVHDFMVDKVYTVTMTDNLHDVLQLMTRHNFSAVPVVDDDDPRRVIALLERNTLGEAYGEKIRSLKSGSGSA
ncbi:MAG: chloride channel protein [Planctomycetota bacterium]|nr:MAG: chloride channel protein [Planctomycetota bacterium]